MKNRVIITKAVKEVKENDRLVQKEFSKGVYEWFMDGRAEGEILSFAKWDRNKRLNNTINRIPREIHHVQKYIMEEECAA